MNLEGKLRELTDARADVRAGAARELRTRNETRVLRALAGALGDDSIDVRDTVAQTLVEMGDQRTVRLLVPLLRSDKPSMRNAARRVLDSLASAAPDLLVELSRDPDARMRIFAANILGGTGDHEMTARLTEMLRDPDSNVRDAAINALGMLGDPLAVEPLGALLDEEAEPWMCFSVLDALARIGGSEAAASLARRLSANQGEMRTAVADALARLDAGDAVPALRRLREQSPAGAVDEIDRIIRRIEGTS